MAVDDDGAGGGNRATVALAVEKIDGLKELTRAEFGEVKDRLTKLEGLPERVTRLEAYEASLHSIPDRVGGLERVTADHEHRVLDLERSRNAECASWVIHWPTLLPALIGLAVAVVALFTS